MSQKIVDSFDRTKVKDFGEPFAGGGCTVSIFMASCQGLELGFQSRMWTIFELAKCGVTPRTNYWS